MQYEIGEELGRGGMAVVYRVKTTGTAEAFAMKRPLPWPECDERLKREISVMSTLDHPNVMPVLDSGTDDDGKHWYVMPLAVGSLKTLWTGGRLGSDPEMVCRRVLEEICLGLGAMHDSGLVHRDVKPQNIIALLDEDQHDGFRWVIADCGLVRRPLGETSYGLTGSASRLGSAGYIAPEAFGEPHLVTKAADIYGLGRVFGWLLTGKDPVLTEPLLPDGSWRPVVRSFTRQDPLQRPQSTSDALSAAQELLLQLPVSEKVDFRLKLADKGGALHTDNPLWELVLERLDDYDFMIDDVIGIESSAINKLATVHPQRAATITTRMAEHLAEGDYGPRNWDQLNHHLGWLMAALQGLAATGQIGPFEDVAIPYCKAVERWDRYPHNAALSKWLPDLRAPAGDAMARAIHQAGATAYFRAITPGRRFSSPLLAGLLES